MGHRVTTEKSPVPEQQPAGESFTEDHLSSIAGKVHRAISEILTRDESIVYVAIQRRPFVPVAPGCIVFTNRRFIIYRPKILGGVDFDDHVWREFKSSKLSEGVMGSTFRIFTEDGKAVSMDYLPRSQARRLYSLTREMEEKVRRQSDRWGVAALDGCGRECDYPASQSNRSKGRRGKGVQLNRQGGTSLPKSGSGLRRSRQEVAVG